MKTILPAAALLLALTLGACSSTTKTTTNSASMGMVNSTCPFSGQPASADHVAQYEGQKVGFCCAGCVKKFNNADAANKAALMSKAK